MKIELPLYTRNGIYVNASILFVTYMSRVATKMCGFNNLPILVQPYVTNLCIWGLFNEDLT